MDRALQINPQGMGLWEIKVKLAIAEKGDFSVYEQAVEKGKSLPMSSEERLKILGDASQIFSYFNASTSRYCSWVRGFPMIHWRLFRVRWP